MLAGGCGHYQDAGGHVQGCVMTCLQTDNTHLIHSYLMSSKVHPYCEDYLVPLTAALVGRVREFGGPSRAAPLPVLAGNSEVSVCH